MLLTDMDKDASADDNKVTLMTVHSAKGLEYKYVYIVGVEENLFPSQRAMESPDGMEEERRLFYVALTRAKTAATISYAEMRFKWGNMEFSRPSRFLREIDSKYVQADFEGSDERADAFARGGGRFGARPTAAAVRLSVPAERSGGCGRIRRKCFRPADWWIFAAAFDSG